MKIAMVREYTAPARDSQGAGRIMEGLAKSFVKMGHEVVLKANPDSTGGPVPLVKEIPSDCDIIHFCQWHPGFNHDQYGTPWVATLFGGGMETDPEFFRASKQNPHLICVSEFVRNRLDALKYIWNSSDPDDFIYSDKKEDYFLWMAGTDWGESKGLFSTIRLAKKLRFKLLLAGSGKNQQMIETIKTFCDDKIQYIGSINGKEKAEILSKAKAFILLTQVGDACPTVVSESMLSGTPVIGSTFGSVPELINNKVGFVCKNDAEFAKAIINIDKIDSKDCRELGLSKMSSDVAAKEYVKTFEKMIKHGTV
jgi:glycosyltransferase involved in cell wall biosynthesis